MNKDVLRAFPAGFFEPGHYVLVDGQYGSTGKGLIAAALAECFSTDVDWAVSNAGPNSGHTSYYKGEKIVLKQLPMFAVIAGKANGTHGFNCGIYLTGGAVIDKQRLELEVREYRGQLGELHIHPTAAVITNQDKEMDQRALDMIASTGQGVGPALAKKIIRTNERAVYGGCWSGEPSLSRELLSGTVNFFEVSQGYSLGINSGFYPHTTSRECTVAQAISDASASIGDLRKVIMSCRTYPIRVGDTSNSSGPCYPDQKEIKWEELGVAPETTTVTGRQRRIFTWSDTQFMDAAWANRPDVIFLNFVNYLDPFDIDNFVRKHVLQPYARVFRKEPDAILLGHGPKSSEISLWRN